ncbi:MAG TPA: glycoside hydrolase family 3 protein [Leptospiraceae bacterium]|nr:glycoside hydrolase family 3 protein [Leptospiraceae bacterium]HNH01497.1 glycoside hydrolase family 3 protein [Leptospiraceae bacterium]HNI90766.1 glycoside hydrolase family 3 protein [Leptospiraceae bacterium]HNK93854.1 glycoside hydrolase family 3 protein [Leptospiraceae bacterium]
MKYFLTLMKIKKIIPFLIISFSISATDLTEIRKRALEHASEIVSKMSDEEKAGQVIHIAIPKNYLDEVAIAELQKVRPGGVILFGVNLGKKKEIRALTKGLQNEMKNLNSPPLFISIDQEGGRVVRVEKGVTGFPGALAIGQTKNPAYAFNVGLITSYELNNLGINLLLAPVMDINNNPENPVINTRSFGMTLDAGDLAISYEKGARIGGAVPVIKHFPGHGDTNVDSHLGLPVIEKTESQLLEFELIPFQKSIQEGARAVMSAHIVYPNLDPKYPSTLSKKILTDILRKKLGFEGIILTDAMEMHAISKNYQNEKTGTLAILAGADIILLTSWGNTTTHYYNMILESLKNKEFDVDGKNMLDESLKRQIALKIENGLFHTSYSYKKIEDEELEKFITEKRKISTARYNDLKIANIPELNARISTEAIRSYKTPFTSFTISESRKFAYVCKNENVKNELIDLNIPYYTEKKVQKLLKKKLVKTLVFDTKDQKELDAVSNLAEKNPSIQFILLHYGSPFLKLPNQGNVKILFSFSPTKDSIHALVHTALNADKPRDIPVTELIFSRIIQRN